MPQFSAFGAAVFCLPCLASGSLHLITCSPRAACPLRSIGPRPTLWASASGRSQSRFWATLRRASPPDPLELGWHSWLLSRSSLEFLGVSGLSLLSTCFLHLRGTCTLALRLLVGCKIQKDTFSSTVDMVVWRKVAFLDRIPTFESLSQAKRVAHP